jgi:hypothetical protein
MMICKERPVFTTLKNFEGQRTGGYYVNKLAGGNYLDKLGCKFDQPKLDRGRSEPISIQIAASMSEVLSQILRERRTDPL